MRRVGSRLNRKPAAGQLRREMFGERRKQQRDHRRRCCDMRRRGKRASLMLMAVAGRFVRRIVIHGGHVHLGHIRLVHVADDEETGSRAVWIRHPACGHQAAQQHRGKRETDGGAAEARHGAELCPFRTEGQHPRCRGASRNPAVSGGVQVQQEPDTLFGNFSRVLQFQFWAAVLFQGTVGPSLRGRGLIAGGVSSMRKPPARIVTHAGPQGSRGLRVRRGVIGPFEQTLRWRSSRILTTHNTREALSKQRHNLPSAKKLNACDASASMRKSFTAPGEKARFRRYARIAKDFAYDFLGCVSLKTGMENSAPDLMPEGQRAVTVLVLV